MTLKSRIPLVPLLLLWGIVGAVQTSRADSPYVLSSGRDGVIAGTGFLSTVTTNWLSGRADSLTQAEVAALSRDSIPGFDRGASFNYSPSAAKASDILVGSVAVSPLALMLATAPMRGDWPILAAIYAETILFATSVPGYTKGTVRRYRPFVYGTEAPMETKLEADSGKSFFSGHSTTAFASAVFISTVFSEYHPDSPARPWVWAGSLALASTVGYLRYAAGKHFPSDILAGAVIGSAIGYLIPWMHKSNQAAASQVAVAPGLLQVQFLF